jgi:GNAT superfamily N-acetyltransferase
LAEAVRASDGYPPRSPDLFTGPEVLAAWVAVEDGLVVGHLGLHETGAEAVMALAGKATGRPAERLAVVARLLVAPTSRRRGLGRRLLSHAVNEAHRADRWPVLDVAREFAAAHALYEACGWTRVGGVTFQFHDGDALRDAESFVYLGPQPPDR